MIKSLPPILLLSHLLLADTPYYYSYGQKVFLNKVVNLSRENSTIDYYIDNQKKSLGVSDTIIVKLKGHTNIDKYLDEFNATLEKKLSLNIYLLRVKNRTFTLDIANRLNEKDDIEYAQPDFIKKTIRR